MALVIKEPTCLAKGNKCWFDPWMGRESLEEGPWQPTPVYLPAESPPRGAWQAD